MSGLISYCTPDYNKLNGEDKIFDLNWSEKNSSFVPHQNLEDVYNAFEYTGALSISSYPMSGVYTSYLGGGYVYKMNGNGASIISNLTILEQNNWIDRQTRAVFVEFNTYNPNIKMFSYNYLLFEILPTGSIVTSYRFSPMSLFDDRTSLFSFGTICAIIYLVLIFILTMKQIYRIKVEKWQYFKQMWTYIDLTLIAFSYTSFAIWLYRIWEAQKIMTLLSLSPINKTKFISLQMLAYWDDVLASMLAFCACMGSLKFFKILQFNHTIRILIRTMKIGFSAMFSFGAMFLLFALAWMQASYVIFNDQILSLSTFVKSMETGFLLLLGKFQLSEILRANPTYSVLYYVSYNTFLVMIMLNMFISIVTDAFAEAQIRDKDADPLDLEDYFYSKIGKILNLIGKKKRDSKELGVEESKMKDSLALKGKYMDLSQNWEYKTGQLINVLLEVSYF
jgi:polycystin 1L2